VPNRAAGVAYLFGRAIPERCSCSASTAECSSTLLSKIQRVVDQIEEIMLHITEPCFDLGDVLLGDGVCETFVFDQLFCGAWIAHRA